MPVGFQISAFPPEFGDNSKKQTLGFNGQTGQSVKTYRFPALNTNIHLLWMKMSTIFQVCCRDMGKQKAQYLIHSYFYYYVFARMGF